MAKLAKFLFGLFAFWLLVYVAKELLIEFAPAWLKLTFSIGVVSSVLFILLMVGYAMWGYARRVWMVRPDERGNLPIMMSFFGKPQNLNLAGADESPMAWALWQQTNNGMPMTSPKVMPIEAQIEAQRHHQYALMSGQDEVIDSIEEDL